MENPRDCLKSAVAKQIKAKLPSFDQSLHADISFSKLGLDSMGHVELSTVIENTLSISVEPDIAFNYPTLNSLVGFVCENLLDKEVESLNASA